LHAAAVFSARLLCSFHNIDWGFLIFGALCAGTRDQGSTRGFSTPLLSSSLCVFSVLLLDLGQKVVGAIPSWGVKKKGFPMGKYEEMGKGRNRMGWDISG
jgi:hypothetical protein